MAKKNLETPLGFEQSIARLEEIISQTDSPSTELEEIISLVEEGTKLIRHCKTILKKAELRIETLENSEEDNEEESTEQNSDNEGTSFSLN